MTEPKWAPNDPPVLKVDPSPAKDQPMDAGTVRKLIERAIQMGYKVGSEGGSAGEITYEDVIEGADYD